MTEAEHRIWMRLRAHRFEQSSFRRQFPIGPYVVDFICRKARLIVAIDGGQHAAMQARHDEVRDAWLRAQRFTVLRFWNNDVFFNIAGVTETIANALQAAPPSLTLPRKGGGDMLRFWDRQEVPS